MSCVTVCDRKGGGPCRLSCGSLSAGEHEFTVDDASMAKVRKWLAPGVAEEHGGHLVPHTDGSLRCTETKSDGQYNEIRLSPGVVMFHTHPSGCMSRTGACGVSAPSPEDMREFVRMAQRGCAGHVVFSRTSNYTVTIPSMRDVASPETAFRAFTELHDRFTDDSDADALDEAWAELAERLGFSVDVVAARDAPVVTISVTGRRRARAAA